MGIQMPHTSCALKDKMPDSHFPPPGARTQTQAFVAYQHRLRPESCQRKGSVQAAKRADLEVGWFDYWQCRATSQGSALEHPKLLEQQEGKNKHQLRTAASYLCLEVKRAGSMRDPCFATIPTRREAIYTSTAWQFPPSRFSGSWAASTAPSTAPARARQLPAMPGTSADRPAHEELAGWDQPRHVDPSWKLGGRDTAA